MKQILPQRCPLAMIYMGWVLYSAVLILLALSSDYLVALAWLVAYPLLVFIYLRTFPAISTLAGYGSVKDVPDDGATFSGVAAVTLYTAVGCPFCPIVHRRLEELSRKLGLEIETVDLTLRPDRLAAAGIRSVPVVEAAGQRLTGNATSRELADFVRGALQSNR